MVILSGFLKIYILFEQIPNQSLTDGTALLLIPGSSEHCQADGGP